MKTDTQQIQIADGNPLGLVTGKRLLEILFPDPGSRPSLRWLEMQRAAKKIPFVRISRLVFHDPVRVREALNNQRTAKFGGLN